MNRALDNKTKLILILQKVLEKIWFIEKQMEDLNTPHYIISPKYMDRQQILSVY